MKKWPIALLLILFMCPAFAQDLKSELQIRHRRAAFTLMASYFSRILNVVEGEVAYNRQAVIDNARLVETLSRLPWDGFAPGTEFGDTRAKPDIWLDEDRFRELAGDMQKKVRALRVAAESGDLARVKNAFVVARKSCGACHDEFRKKLD